jgi:glycerate 2-kinase
MTGKLFQDAHTIVQESIREVLPDSAVKNVLENTCFPKKVYVVAVGKAAWKMAAACEEVLKGQIEKGIVLTKYGHSEGDISRLEILEAGHPVPDENSVAGTQKILEMVSGLQEDDTLLFLLSGGGSALFEKPEEGLTLADIQEATELCLACGAHIEEINTLRKRLSAVKGGKFAKLCGKARILEIILSDVVGDRLDMIASGPACADTSTCADALRIVEKYNLPFRAEILSALQKETPDRIDNVEVHVTGSVSEFSRAAAKTAKSLGYTPYIVSTSVDCEARELGKYMASVARTIMQEPDCAFHKPCAVICGGETVVTLKGKGKGGRNQEIALSAALGIEGRKNLVIFSVSSDGTDGPTDAAGGIVDGDTVGLLRSKGLEPEKMLAENDSYRALQQSGGLLLTGATGTNVNDITVLLIE